MKSAITLFFLLSSSILNLNAQVVLNADGPGNTYELINTVLAPHYDAIETPDCGHTVFGRHIDEIFDADLNTNVFRFTIHVTPDNDRCNSSTDRQRNEIKTYDKSPNNLKGVEGEIVIYKWRFKLDAGFQPSPNFTHIHQLKSVGGLYEATPMYTLTARKGTPDKLELRYAETSSQTTLKQTDLTPFKGNWVDATETVTFGASGTYSIVIKKVSDGSELFSYSNNSIINWQTGADFVRPKWGIYRSLLNPSDLRDETVLFANFSIEEVSTLSVKNSNASTIKIHPNPATNGVLTIDVSKGSFNEIYIFDNLGKQIYNQINQTNILDVSFLKTGLYFLILKKDKQPISTQKLIIP